jgi:hypothetical protein
MNQVGVKIAALLTLVSLTAGCSVMGDMLDQPGIAPPADPDIPPDIMAALEENLRAAEAEDLLAYMATIHEDSDLYGSTESLMENLFELYDLDYEVETLELVSLAGGEAKLRVTQVTRKVSGPAFRDNRITVLHALRKSGGQWKFYNTVVLKIEYLD